MKIRIHTDEDCFDALANEWNDLLARSFFNTVFLTREWQQTIRRAFSDGELRVIEIRDDDDKLIGIAPLSFHQDEEKTVVKFAAHKEISDYLDFIFERGREAECHRAVVDYLKTQKWDVLRFVNLVEHSPTLKSFVEMLNVESWKVDIEFEDVCPIIALPTSFDDYLNSLDGKERRELQRKLRRASEETRVVITNNRATLDKDMDDFLILMRASLPEKSDFMTPQMENFFRACARAMFDAGWLQLSFLEVGDTEPLTRAAAYFNFDYNDEVLVYNSGLDPTKFSFLSPGQVLIGKLIERAISDNRTHFDFLQGNEDYKHKLGGKDVKLYQLSVTR
jgi:CelD/BcsL family acetyltransferase involved in cellulose biosynthesis